MDLIARCLSGWSARVPRLNYVTMRRLRNLFQAASLAYPIRNGIPVMLVDEAREIDV